MVINNDKLAPTEGNSAGTLILFVPLPKLSTLSFPWVCCSFGELIYSLTTPSHFITYSTNRQISLEGTSDLSY